MCVSIGKAAFSATRTYTGVTPDGRHLGIYGNAAQSMSAGPNAMVLMIPGRFSATDIIDTGKCSKFLTQIADAVAASNTDPDDRSAPPSDFFGFGPKSPAIVVDRGIYTVVAGNPRSAHEALSRVPQHKRPTISRDYIEFLSAHYGPVWTAVFACFNNADSREATPIVIEYDPIDPTKLFVPGLDNGGEDSPVHDGLPNLSARVLRDHTIGFFAPGIFPAAMLERGTVQYTGEQLPERLRNVLPQNVVGVVLKHTSTRNGDFYLPIDRPFQTFEPKRALEIYTPGTPY